MKYQFLFVAMFFMTTAALAEQPAITYDSETNEFSTQISVMNYNVAGMPWPLERGRGDEMKDIRQQFAAMQAAGDAPDILLLQEAFRKKSRNIGVKTGYEDWAFGPKAGKKDGKLHKQEKRSFVKARSFWKGERLWGKWVGSGLAAFSEYDIGETVNTPFRRRVCAGFDCFANKGMLLVRVNVPGLPTPIDVITTHLNSRGSSGVKEERSREAFKMQVDELSAFIAAHHNPEHPLVFAGDFNIRDDEVRREYVKEKLPPTFTRAYCAREGCGEDDRPWHHQDQQGFVNGSVASIVPIKTEKMFNEQIEGRTLSDHAAYLVTYRVTWKATMVASN